MVIEDLTSNGNIRRVTRWGEPVLHNVTRPVTAYDEELHQLIRDMFATMVAAEGVGLAATQVGVDLAVFVYDCPDKNNVSQVGVVCNPEVILPKAGHRKLEVAEEGCLSWPGGYSNVGRPDTARCIGTDAYGNPIEVEGTGMLARCLQHETDHLSGIVFGDRLAKRARKILDKTVEDVAYRYPDDWPISPKLNSAS